jgi:histidine triad (HIT) family protein
MASLFSKIISGEIPSYKITETEHCYAFLDVFPLREGHVLVVPKLEVDNLFDLPDSIYSELWQLSKSIAKAMQTCLPCKKIGVAVIGLELPHAHIHLVPITEANDLNFTQAKLKLEAKDMFDIANKIATALAEKQ